MYYVYMLQNEEKEIYTGYTEDLRRRIEEHNEGKTQSTKNKRWKLIYYEAYLEEKDARERERKLKQNGQAKRRLKERNKRALNL